MSHEQSSARRWWYGAVAAAGVIAAVGLAPVAAADPGSSHKSDTQVVTQAPTKVSHDRPVKIKTPVMQALCLGCINPTT